MNSINLQSIFGVALDRAHPFLSSHPLAGSRKQALADEIVLIKKPSSCLRAGKPEEDPKVERPSQYSEAAALLDDHVKTILIPLLKQQEEKGKLQRSHSSDRLTSSLKEEVAENKKRACRVCCKVFLKKPDVIMQDLRDLKLSWDAFPNRFFHSFIQKIISYRKLLLLSGIT